MFDCHSHGRHQMCARLRVCQKNSFSMRTKRLQKAKGFDNTYAKTCHSVGTRTTVLVPATVFEVSFIEPDTQSCPGHARPTSLEDGQFVISVQYAFESFCAPRQTEKLFNRELRSVLAHGTFHGVATGVVAGHSEFTTVKLRNPIEILKDRSKRSEAWFTTLIIFSLADWVELNEPT